MYDVIVCFNRMYDVIRFDWMYDVTYEVDGMFDVAAADLPEQLGRCWNQLLVDLGSGPALSISSILISSLLKSFFAVYQTLKFA